MRKTTSFWTISLIAFRTILSVLAISLIAGCQVNSNPAPVTSSQTERQSNLEQQVSRLATQTQMARQTLGAIPGKAATMQPTLSAPQAPPPTMTPALETAGAFQRLSPDEAYIAGRVLSLQPAQDGALWIVSEGGISRYQHGEWQGYLAAELGRVIGRDQQGRFWISGDQGDYIAVWDFQATQIYSATHGWQPLGNTATTTVYSGLLNDPWGNMWVKTSQDLRVFDGHRWQSFPPAELGMPAAEKENLMSEYELQVISSTGEIWAGRCDWDTSSPHGGGGVRRFDGTTWFSVGGEVTAGCVTAIRESPSGLVWVAQDDRLWRYDTHAGDWAGVPLPAPPEDGFSYGFFRNLTLDPQGNPWPELALCNGDGCFHGEMLFRLQGDAWIPINATSDGFPHRLMFDSTGLPWLFSADTVYRIEDDTPVESAHLIVMAAALDLNGKMWLVAQGAGPPAIWVLK